jgi:hypothetical protein
MLLWYFSVPLKNRHHSTLNRVRTASFRVPYNSSFNIIWRDLREKRKADIVLGAPEDNHKKTENYS